MAVLLLFCRLSSLFCSSAGYRILTTTDISSERVVDYGGHTWTMPRKALESMWAYLPSSFDNSEDLHVSASAYLAHKMLTIVPRQVSSDPSPS